MVLRIYDATDLADPKDKARGSRWLSLKKEWQRSEDMSEPGGNRLELSSQKKETAMNTS